MAKYNLYKYATFYKNIIAALKKHKILAAIMTVGFGSSLLKFIAFFKELVVAWRFGVSDELDALLIALVIPNLINSVFAGTLRGSSIPIYFKVKEQEGLESANRVLSGITLLFILILSLLMLVMVVTAHLYLPFLASGFSHEKLLFTSKILYWVSPIVILSGLTTIWGATLNACECFTLTALSPAVIPLTTITLLFFAKPLGIFALVGGIVGGTLLELIILGIGLHHQRVFLYPRWYGNNIYIRQVFSQYLLLISGGFLMNCTNLVDKAMAAMLSSGSVSILNYGYKLTAFPVMLITKTLSQAIIPYFSKMVALRDWVNIKKTLTRYIILISALAIPITIFILVFSTNIIDFLFQKGSFNSSDIGEIAKVQGFYSLQIPFRGPGVLARLVISSAQKNHFVVLGSCGNLFLNLPLNYIFMNAFGIAGIALSTSLVYVFSCCFLLFFAIKLIKKNN